MNTPMNRTKNKMTGRPFTSNEADAFRANLEDLIDHLRCAQAAAANLNARWWLDDFAGYEHRIGELVSSDDGEAGLLALGRLLFPENPIH